MLILARFCFGSGGSLEASDWNENIMVGDLGKEKTSDVRSFHSWAVPRTHPFTSATSRPSERLIGLDDAGSVIEGFGFKKQDGFHSDDHVGSKVPNIL